MNLNDILTQPFILTLFKRDDGVRFLLGSGAYEFKESQLHFAANTFSNDVVEVQGSDGVLLAGQVRRPSTQVFDGYIGDGSTIKSTIEQYRTDFMRFFQKNHFYTAIYIFSDGTAIQRRRGYIVDAPEVKELYQEFPEYHVAFSFEDVNYYKYGEDAGGEESYSNLAQILSQIAVSGGLVWDDGGEPTTETKTVSGNPITIQDAAADTLTKVDLNGDTFQQQYSGKNVLDVFASDKTPGTTTTNNGVDYTLNSDGTITVNGTATARSDYTILLSTGHRIDGTNKKLVGEIVSGTFSQSVDFWIYDGSYDKNTSISCTEVGTPLATNTLESGVEYVRVRVRVQSGASANCVVRMMVIDSSISDLSYEPYVGGTNSPNPDYPQAIRTATGQQTITIDNGGGNIQTFPINLGKNLFDKNNVNYFNGYLASGSGSIATGANDKSIYIQCNPNTTYTIQKIASTRFRVGAIPKAPENGMVATNRISNDSGTTITINTGPTETFLIVYCYNTGDTATEQQILDSIQIEVGDTATTYAAYFTPIELCKIIVSSSVVAQDYIYKSGADWFVHKETEKVVYNSGTGWSRNAQLATVNRFRLGVGDTYRNATQLYSMYCNQLRVEETYSGNYEHIYKYSTYLYAFFNNSRCADATALGTYLASNPLICYFALATPTDTQITDATLISQLEALVGGSTYQGYNIITASANGLNLASPMTITYTAEIPGDGMGIDWDSNGAIWEPGGGGGNGTVVSVDSITNVLPTIRIVGPAYNPSITNITTNQTIRYTGNVLESQELVIDVSQKTAKLNGTSVIQNVEGNWLELAPGNNRLFYDIDNVGDYSATIEWQEIVG